MHIDSSYNAYKHEIGENLIRNKYKSVEPKLVKLDMNIDLKAERLFSRKKLLYALNFLMNLSVCVYAIIFLANS